MTLLNLASLYFLFGLGFAAVALLGQSHREKSARRKVFDGLMLLLCWPLYAPFVLSLLAQQQADDSATKSTEHIDLTGNSMFTDSFMAALNAARQTALAPLLPDQATVHRLAQRLRVVQAKIHEIDKLLRNPDFDEDLAQQRLQELHAREASQHTCAMVEIRMQNIRHMKKLRQRFKQELDEVDELLAQLRTQAELVRLAGRVDGQNQDLLQELLIRVESLDSMLASEFDQPGSMQQIAMQQQAV